MCGNQFFGNHKSKESISALSRRSAACKISKSVSVTARYCLPDVSDEENTTAVGCEPSPLAVPIFFRYSLPCTWPQARHVTEARLIVPLFELMIINILMAIDDVEIYYGSFLAYVRLQNHIGFL